MALTLFEELLRLAEAQLEAARRVDARALGDLAEARRRLQDTIDWDAVLATPPPERAELRALAARLRAVDARTRACGHNVLAVLAPLFPDTAPATYNRRGILRGA